MENGESNKETKSKHFKILSFVSMIVISDSHHTIHPKRYKYTNEPGTKRSKISK